MRYKDHLHLSDEVKQAKHEQKPIVALESTIISHGMPYPKNIQTAMEVEEIVRKGGAVPATIAILDGKIKIGLLKEELELLGESQEIVKSSRRDLPYLLAMRRNGATTVAATMICAKLAGIQVFVTGGIGGVHRGGHETMDISCDLQELSKTNVAVVCSGAKSILDIGLTLEYLETHGVPVIGYKTTSFPAFYSRTSPYVVDYRLDCEKEIAQMICTKWDLQLNGGVVIANPVPERDALKEDKMNECIQSALVEGEKKKVTGKEVTPFLLDKVKYFTKGKSLDTNISLVKNNALLGSKIAREIHFISSAF